MPARADPDMDGSEGNRSLHEPDLDGETNGTEDAPT